MCRKAIALQIVSNDTELSRALHAELAKYPTQVRRSHLGLALSSMLTSAKPGSGAAQPLGLLQSFRADMTIWTAY